MASDLAGRVRAASALLDSGPEEVWEGEGLDLEGLKPLVEEAQERLDTVDSLDGSGRVEVLMQDVPKLSALKDELKRAGVL